jgi:hypothetical protein
MAGFLPRYQTGFQVTDCFEAERGHRISRNVIKAALGSLTAALTSAGGFGVDTSLLKRKPQKRVSGWQYGVSAMPVAQPP